MALRDENDAVRIAQDFTEQTFYLCFLVKRESAGIPSHTEETRNTKKIFRNI